MGRDSSPSHSSSRGQGEGFLPQSEDLRSVLQVLPSLPVLTPVRTDPESPSAPGKAQAPPGSEDHSGAPGTYRVSARGLRIQVGRRHLDLAEHLETRLQGVCEFGQAQSLHGLGQRLHQAGEHLREVLGLHLRVQLLGSRHGLMNVVRLKSREIMHLTTLLGCIFFRE